MAKEKAKKQDKLVPYEYLYNDKKKAVTYGVLAHGMLFVGSAKCGKDDKFDPATGEAIAKMRAVLKQRKFDLELTRRCIANMTRLMNWENEEFGVSSPHYMRAIQAATEEMKAQRAHIRDLENRIEAYN